MCQVDRNAILQRAYPIPSCPINLSPSALQYYSHNVHHHPLPTLSSPSLACPGLASTASTPLSTSRLTSSFFLISSNSLPSLSLRTCSSLFHTKFPAPPRPDRATGISWLSGCHGVLTCGFEDVGMAVESEGWVNVPSFWSSVGWYQFPAPPRPMCA